MDSRKTGYTNLRKGDLGQNIVIFGSGGKSKSRHRNKRGIGGRPKGVKKLQVLSHVPERKKTLTGKKTCEQPKDSGSVRPIIAESRKVGNSRKITREEGKIKSEAT